MKRLTFATAFSFIIALVLLIAVPSVILADDGDVDEGDVEVQCGGPQTDFGDAPDPLYPTLDASNGAKHYIMSGLYLGSRVDAEFDAHQNADASGDDIAGSDDEDGVVFDTPLVPGEEATVTVTCGPTAGKLDAWIDFNVDGDWDDANEQIFDSIPLIASTDQQLNFTVPPGTLTGQTTFARFRFSINGGLDNYDGVGGMCVDKVYGEVEDYPVMPVPELSAIILMSLGIVSLGGYTFLRKQKRDAHVRGR